MGVMRSELVMKSIVPVVMAGVLGIYGLIIDVIISTGINTKAKPYYVLDGYAHLAKAFTLEVLHCRTHVSSILLSSGKLKSCDDDNPTSLKAGKHNRCTGEVSDAADSLSYLCQLAAHDQSKLIVDMTSLGVFQGFLLLMAELISMTTTIISYIPSQETTHLPSHTWTGSLALIKVTKS